MASPQPRTDLGKNAAASGLSELCCVCRQMPGQLREENVLVCAKVSCQKEYERRKNHLSMLGKCRHCLRPLVPETQHSGVCSESSCQFAHWRYLAHAQREKQRAALAEQLHGLKHELQDQGLEKFVFLELPAMTRSLAPVAEERRDKLREHLQMLARVAAERIDEPEVATPPKSSLTSPPEHPADQPAPGAGPFITAACRTCRGHCCQHGAEKAYLTADQFLHLLRDHPSLTLADLVGRYLDFVPEEAYEASCIFHSRTGCTIPATWRSTTCHAFLCHGLRFGLDSARKRGIPIVMVATEPWGVIRHGTFESDHCSGNDAAEPKVRDADG